jgi:hypothetical protein
MLGIEIGPAYPVKSLPGYSYPGQPYPGNWLPRSNTYYKLPVQGYHLWGRPPRHLDLHCLLQTGTFTLPRVTEENDAVNTPTVLTVYVRGTPQYHVGQTFLLYHCIQKLITRNLDRVNRQRSKDIS